MQSGSTYARKETTPAIAGVRFAASLMHPALYETFARFWVGDGTLATIPDAELDRIADLGFDYVWAMGVWTLGEVGPPISRTLYPGTPASEVIGSPYAVARYAVDPRLGGDAALAELRKRLAKRSIGLIVDFVPNHTARDHHWVREHPEMYVHDANGVACGKDPYFPAWTDTAQLDHRAEITRDVLIETLETIADRADGVRCDMAMLVLADIFDSTWSHSPPRAKELAHGEFWADAIDHLRGRPFKWIAEAYWDLETRLQYLGFDFTYDKTLYDLLLRGTAPQIRQHLAKPMDCQLRSVRFLENHDEPRLASLMSPEQADAALAITLTLPGMRFIHDGQIEGRKQHASIHLARRADEPVDPIRQQVHTRLLSIPRRGSFSTLTTHHESLIAHRWQDETSAYVVIVNYSPERVRSQVHFDLHGIAGRTVHLHDWMDDATYTRDGSELVDEHRGLFVDLAPWQPHVFSVTTKGLWRG